VSSLDEAITRAASKKISAYERRKNRIQDANARRSRRSVARVPLAEPVRPSLWSLDPGFDPFHVRSRAQVIAHTIEGRLRDRSYTPLRPAGFQLTKSGGGTREVTSFAIADEVISGRLYRSLLGKNRSKLSPRSYAYRDDQGAIDALSHMTSDWREEKRLFVAQYDFSDYFESIDHEHLRRTFRALNFTMTSMERYLLEAFLEAPLPYLSREEKSRSATKRVRGIHQGTSISLLLANVAATPLDRSLERLGVSFVRYADDLIVWSRDYASICDSVDALNDFAEESNCELNLRKSRGIRLMVREGPEAEMATCESVDYLSHSVSLVQVGMRKDANDKIRRRINAFIYENLLREPMRKKQDLGRLRKGLDRDYVTLVWQLRRYLYGPLSESAVQRLLYGPVPRALALKGAIARFPLVDNDDQLRELDGFMCNQVHLALRKRQKLLSAASLALYGEEPKPWGLHVRELRDFGFTSSTTNEHVDARLPSAVRMSRVLRRAVRTHGLGVVGSGSRLYGN